MADKIQKHVYEYGGFEVMGDCGICGAVESDSVHLNLFFTLGNNDTTLTSYGGLFKFSHIHWNGRAVYVNESDPDRKRVQHVDGDYFRRLGQPEYLKFDIEPVWAGGQPVWP